MISSDRSTIVTLVATAPAGTAGTTDDAFIDGTLRTLASKKSPRNRIARVSSIRDIDLELSNVLSRPNDRARVQIIGHALSGGLALGAFWLAEPELQARAFKFPYYILDTTPAALGLLSKHAGKVAEVMLVGCNIGSAVSFGHPINGRTLTYTLAELLQCDVLGADDVISPDEFDDSGWYAPGAQRARPKGWRWTVSAAPSWAEPSPPAAPRPRPPIG